MRPDDPTDPFLTPVPPLRQPLLELEDVSRVYGEEVEIYALRQVSLKIMPGEFMSIVGPSGSGKSTMLGLLGVLDLPTSGTVRIAGQDVSTLDDPDRSRLRGDSIGFVFQQFHLVPHLTAVGKRRDRIAVPGDPPSGPPSAGLRGPRPPGPGPARQSPTRPAVGRRAATGGPRPRHRDGAAHDPGRRTHRRPRLGQRHPCAGDLRRVESPERAVVMVTHDAIVASTAARRQVSMRDGQIVSDESRVA